jgi:hypothetical protein
VTVRATFDATPTTVTLIVSKPDGTTVSPVVNSGDAPTYSGTVTANQVGTWGYRFEGTGAATGVVEGYFVVLASPVLTGVPDYTYDLATDIGQLRLLIDDRDLTHVGASVLPEQRSAIFSDAELQVFLTDSGGNVYIAGNRGLYVLARRIGGDINVNYGSLRADLLRQAKEFRDQAYADAPASEFAEIAYNDFAARRIIDNSIRRTG